MEGDIASSLRRLSENYDSILTSNYNSFPDAKITVTDGREIGVHRGILSARSSFFRTLFSGDETRVKLEMKDLAKDLEVSFEALNTVLKCLYSGKLRPLRCVCADGECEHVACRPAVDFVVNVLYASSVFEIPELVNHCQKHLLDILDNIAADDILEVLFVANICGKECNGLLTRCIENIVRSDVEDTTRYRALDSADLESVRMLLKDDPCALHHVVAYCDVKTTMKLLDLAVADVDHRNRRGFTLLHIAAMRKEPKIIVSLLTKGAHPAALTSDGRKALEISKRLARAADYNKSTERTPKDRLCIEILELVERTPPLLGEASASRAKLGDNLRMMLAYLEHRVALAKHFFPTEAEVAMDVAQVDGTCEFASCSTNSTSMAGAQRKTVDLHDTAFKIEDEHLNRIRALSKTVELGKLFFPRCSKVLDDLLDDNELSKLASMENGTEEERLLKKRRYEETRETITKALQEDMRDNDELAVLRNAIVDNNALSEPALMQNGSEDEHQLISDETRDMELQDLGEEFWEDMYRVWDA